MEAVIIGCGYVGRRLAQCLLDAGHGVTGVVRSEASAAAVAASLEAEGLRVLRHDLDADTPPADLPPADLMVWLAPPPGEGTEDPRIRRFLLGLPPALLPARVVYLSTTAVYGDAGGGWVDETTAPRPSSGRGERRLAAELTLMEIAEERGFGHVIVRVPAIYGPGRIGLDRLRAGEPVVRAEEAPWTNRIHVDDLVTGLLAAAGRGSDGGIYNLTDDAPMKSADFQKLVAEAAGLEPPPEIGMAEAAERFSEARLSFLREDKRVSNRRMKEELGVELRYPTPADAIPECLSDD